MVMIVTGGDKRLRQKPDQHSMQEAPHAYPTGQCSSLAFMGHGKGHGMQCYSHMP